MPHMEIVLTDLGDARLVLLLLEENRRSVGHKGHVGAVQLDGLAVRFQCLRKALSVNASRRSR